jgi:hypothetical protein
MSYCRVIAAPVFASRFCSRAGYTRGIVTPMRGEARMYNRLDERVWT